MKIETKEMKLKDGITKAYETHWSMINTFTVQFDFGANTIWYLHSHVVCAKLLLSFILNVLLLVSLAVARPQVHSTPKGVFCLTHR